MSIQEKWLPSDRKAMDKWLGALIEKITADETGLLPEVQELKDLIEKNARLFMLFHLMLSEIPHKHQYSHDPAGEPQVRSYLVLLQLINGIMRKAPEFNKTEMVGCPLNAVLDWAMGTKAGFAVFLDPGVNSRLKKILQAWAEFLASPDSRYVLNNDAEKGWFGRDAMEAMPDFELEYRCTASLPYFGYQSWDDFFTRKFREGRRPVAAPEDDLVVVNACESAPFRIALNVKRRDRFWIKAQPYSLEDMLAGDPLVDRFVGGTIYQAFLSPLVYHRWHSPVSGTIVKTRHVDGTYFAESLAEGFDACGPNESQGYITALATRALIFIEAKHPAIGLVCLIAVGMSEVSSCEVTVHSNQLVRKGDQLGMFHFGGSSYCLLFGPEVRLQFDLHGETPGLHAGNIRLNEHLATIQV